LVHVPSPSRDEHCQRATQERLFTQTISLNAPPKDYHSRRARTAIDEANADSMLMSARKKAAAFLGLGGMNN